MSYPSGGDAQSVRDNEDREGELLCLKIKAHLEDLFSDSHLAEDGFLLKHVQKNKQGYVSLKLLTCLKTIRALTTDWCMTLEAAAYSHLLEVNDKCTKVRRKEPLPDWLLCSPTSRLLLVWEISEEEEEEDGAACSPEHPSLSERILQKFSLHGSVTSVWILCPGQQIPKELQCYAKRCKELGQHFCAVVRFDRLEAARKAYCAIKAEQRNGKGMCVVPLGSRSMHHVSKDESAAEKNKDQPVEDAPSQENPVEISKCLVQQVPSLPVYVSDEPPETYQKTSLENAVQKDQISTSSKVQSCCGLNQRYSKISWSCGDHEKVSSPSPWVLKRKFAASVFSTEVAKHLNAPWLMQRVLRQPHGPDGDKGFQDRRMLQKQEEIQLPRKQEQIC